MNTDTYQELFTQSDLVSHLNSLGLMPGQQLMLHASVKAVGKVMGGPNVILQALLEVLGAEGTLMMYAGWEDIPDFVLDLPVEQRQRFYEQHPPFDPTISRSVRENSVLAEFLRTWPGAQRSQNPEASIVAVGKNAAQITADHALNYGYGAESPFARLIDLNGYVLLLGAPLDTVTLLHHAENLAYLRHKDIVRYQCPVLQNGVKTWIDIEDFNTGEAHDDYSLEEITQAYIDARSIRSGKVGGAECYLFEARDLTTFAVEWLEARFGDGR